MNNVSSTFGIKKIVSSLAVVASLATVANADFVRVEAGIGGWSYTPSGSFEYNNEDAAAIDTSNEKGSTDAYLWMLVKHPIPFVPNIRLEYSGMSSDGRAKGEFFGQSLVDVPSTMDITQYDIIPYYNILDNTGWVTLDAGLDLKVFNVDYVAKTAEELPAGSLVGDAMDYEESVSEVIPLLYLRARTEIPVTNIGLESDIKYITDGDSTVYDIRVKVDYTLDMVPVFEPAIEIGYRIQKFDTVNEDKDTFTNLQFSGVYAGAMVRF